MIGIFGGSFDPVHVGHVLLATEALEAGDLERLVVVPAARSPHKDHGPHLPPDLRRALLEAAFAHLEAVAVDPLELRRPPPSYAIDTVDALSGREPGAEWAWLIGADQLPGLATWHRVAELVERVIFAVVQRPGEEPELPAIPGLRTLRLATTPCGVSSTQVRERLARGLPLQGFVPEAARRLLVAAR